LSMDGKNCKERETHLFFYLLFYFGFDRYFL